MDTDQSLALEFSSIDDLIKHGFKNIVQSIKHANALPSGINYDFCNTNTSFNKLLMEDGGRILRLMNHVLQTQHIPVSVFNRTNDERVELLVDANDEILEGVANMIDEYSGVNKNPPKTVEIETVSARLSVSGSWNQINKSNVVITSTSGMPQQESHLISDSNTINLISAKNIIRPQQFFKDKIDNSNLYPWEPRLIYKPNSLKHLSLYVEESDIGSIYSHPYEIELERFQPLPSTLTKCKPIKYDDIASTQLIEVSTEEELNRMLMELQKVKEIAVDLEHHSYRSFMGITCLLQISIPGKDYLVDTFVLRDKLWILNEVFTKGSIVKVFHGACSDVQWLQRDLSLYVVNMFDTHSAAVLLNYPRRSLACLIAKFCKFTPNKIFQLADWRIRPLPEELKHYAREDTHYLIHIYHMMRNELIDTANGDNNLLQTAFYQSRDICLKKYIKPICKEDSHLRFYRNCKRFFDNRQLYALKELFHWRDNIAREEDESIGYVLPNHMLLQICESLPREMQGIFACCNPIPPLLRANALEIHNLIIRAREQPLEKAIFKEDNRAKGSTTQFSRLNMDGPLHCPHDIIRTAEFSSDLPTLLNNTNFVPLESKLKDLEIQKTNSIYSMFVTKGVNSVTDAANVMNNLKFLGPYERYKLFKSFAQAEEDKQKKQSLEVDKNIEPEVQQRIVQLKLDCAKFLKSKAKDNTSDLSTNEKQKPYLIKPNKTPAPIQSIRQQYPNTKRKRRPSFDLEKGDSSNKDLTSTIPSFNPRSSRERRQNSQKSVDSQSSRDRRQDSQKNDSIHDCKPQRKGRNNNVQSTIEVSSKKAISHQDRNLEMNRANLGSDKSKRKRNKQRNKRCNQLEEAPPIENFDSDSFEPFDYGTVDFMRFGGISSRASEHTTVISQFKGRGKGNRNFRGKNTNKSAPFFKGERK